jgi:hypothetical protein
LSAIRRQVRSVLRSATRINNSASQASNTCVRGSTSVENRRAPAESARSRTIALTFRRRAARRLPWRHCGRPDSALRGPPGALAFAQSRASGCGRPGDCFRRTAGLCLVIASATKRSSGSGQICTAAHDRLRPDPSVCGLGSARLLLFSCQRGPGYRKGDIGIVWIRERVQASPRQLPAATQSGMAATSGTTMPKRSPMAARLAACTAAEDTTPVLPGSGRVAVAQATTVGA